MDTGFGTPLVTQDRKVVENRVLESQEINEHRSVQCLAHVIAICFVRRQKVLPTKVGEDLFAEDKLALSEF